MKKINYQKLNLYSKENERKLEIKLKRFIWYIFFFPIVKSYLPGSFWRKTFLSIFGSKIGKGCIFKPNLKITKPWNLYIGNNCWFGESLWIDSIDKVTIEDNVCLSQGVYLCTGNHNYKKKEFNLIKKPILIKEQSWISAKSFIGPGSIIMPGTVIKAGSVFSGKTKEGSIYSGNPAIFIKKR